MTLQDRRQDDGDREAIVTLQDRRQDDGDCEPNAVEFMRFTRQEHERGDTAGWRFESGWHERASGLTWAWFSREVNNDDETTEIE